MVIWQCQCLEIGGLFGFQVRQWRASRCGSAGSAKEEYQKNYIYSMTPPVRKHQTAKKPNTSI